MILHTAQVLKVDQWESGKELITSGMRWQINDDARRRYLELGIEVLEVVYMNQEPDGTWRSALPENATHVKVSIEAEGA